MHQRKKTMQGIVQQCKVIFVFLMKYTFEQSLLVYPMIQSLETKLCHEIP